MEILTSANPNDLNRIRIERVQIGIRSGSKTSKRMKTMANSDANRVLVRKGARTLTAEDVQNVMGSIHVPTQTVCTFDRRMNFQDSDTESC
jgi:hypothetical protein